MIAVEFAALGNFNPGQHDSKTLCSFHICKRGTLATVFLDSILDKVSQKTFTSIPFLPLPYPNKSKSYLILATTFSSETSRENSDVISKSLMTRPRENRKPPKHPYPGQAKLWDKFLGHSARAA